MPSNITRNFRTGRSNIAFGEKAGSPVTHYNKDGITVTGTYFTAWADADQFIRDMIGETAIGLADGGGLLFTQRQLPTSFPNQYPQPI
jgi:hypothetical protein